MCKLDIATRAQKMREAIDSAKAYEEESRALHEFLKTKIPQLHHTVMLPDGNASAALESFIADYIECVPDFIEALSSLSSEAGVLRHTEPFLNIAADYFLSPPELIEPLTGLRSLLGEAYLAHRLFEEINDRMMMVSGVPFSPMDTTLSNVIVQDILEHKFANELDLAVHYAIESSFDAKSLFSNQHFSAYLKKQQDSRWAEAIANWPCLANNFSVGLNL